MEYRIDCPCGHYQMVRETAAGATLACACGKTLQVPKLSELRKIAGLTNDGMSPEATIQFLLIGNKLPVGNQCAHCGAETNSIVIVETDCSPPVPRASELIRLANNVLYVLAIFISPWVLLFPREQGREETATLILLPLPVRVCPACQPALDDPAKVKRCLLKDPDYRRLLEKYPNANIAIKK